MLHNPSTDATDLMRAVAASGATALIAPNDDMAICYFKTWHALEKRIPDIQKIVGWESLDYVDRV